MNEYVIRIVAALAIFAGGFYTGKGQSRVDVQERIVYKQGETQTVYKDRIVVVEKTISPDGTVKETTRTEEKEGSSKQTTVSNDKDTQKITTPILSNYSLGLKYWASMADKISVDGTRYRDTNNYEITAGYRTMGEVWIQGGYKLDRQLSLGVALQF